MNRPNLMAKAMERASQVVGFRSHTTLALLVACILPSGIHATLGNLAGSGTAASPYQVADYADLAKIGKGSYSASATYRLVADIDASPSDTADATHGFAPVAFSGTFHGGGHTIANLSIRRAGSDAGLFASLATGALVDSLGLVAASVHGSHHVGPLAATNRGTIRFCHSSGSVTGDTANSHVGGLIGTNFGTIRSSYSSSKDSGDSGISAGGLVGWNSGTLVASHATGTVTAGRFAGGLVGVNSGTLDSSYATGAISSDNPKGRFGGLVGASTSGRIHGCHATGAVSVYGDSVELGGLVGRDSGDTIDSCYASGGVTANADHAVVGGLVGNSRRGAIRRSHATGAVTATGMNSVAGGFVGTASVGSSITICYATGGTTATGGKAVVGGLVGRSSTTLVGECFANGAVTTTGTNALAGGLVGSTGVGDTIRYSYATGPVTNTGSNAFAGGLVGMNRGRIQSCFAVSKVVNSESSFEPGGLVGNDSGTILTSFWGLESASSTVGVGYGLSTGSAIGLVATAMKLPASFPGWDFDNVWIMGAGDSVPRLRAQGATPLAIRFDPNGANRSRQYSWGRDGNRITLSVPGRSFQVTVTDLSGRVVAQASGSEDASLVLPWSRSLVVNIRSRDLHESFVVPALR